MSIYHTHTTSSHCAREHWHRCTALVAATPFLVIAFEAWLGIAFDDRVADCFCITSLNLCSRYLPLIFSDVTLIVLRRLVARLSVVIRSRFFSRWHSLYWALVIFHNVR